MIEPIFIDKAELSPKVVLDKENNKFLITGKSIIENAQDFYSPILTWFDSYFNNPNNVTELILYFEYLNSSSFLQISNLLDLFSQNINKYNLNIKWLYDIGDEIMKEIGKDLQFTYYVKFNFIESNIKDFNLEYS